MAFYYGFGVGDRVTSGGDSKGTVVTPSGEPSEEMYKLKCVPVIWDEDKQTNTISWTTSSSLKKLN